MNEFQAYVFDLDGTIYLGDELIPGARELITELRERGKAVRYLSNNPTKSPHEYVEKLERLGIPTQVEEVTNTVVATARWLAAHEPDAVVYPIAEAPVIEALNEAGITMSDDPAQIDIVLASYDRSFAYEKLQIAFDAIWYHKRARLMTTNPDRYCPFPGGRGEPDAAGIVAAIEATTGATCERNFGKPDTAIAEIALEGLGIEPQQALMVGDRLATDVALAINSGMASALVLTGDSTEAEARALPAAQQPTFIVDSVAQIGELVPVPANSALPN